MLELEATEGNPSAATVRSGVGSSVDGSLPSKSVMSQCPSIAIEASEIGEEHIGVASCQTPRLRKGSAEGGGVLEPGAEGTQGTEK